MKIVTFRIEKRPQVAKKLTLADMPEGVECVVAYGIGSEFCDRVAYRKGNSGLKVIGGSKTSDYLDPASSLRVLRRLDGQPLPCSCAPTDLADGEEGRIYRTCSGLRARLGGQVYGPNTSCGLVYIQSMTCIRGGYSIKNATDYIIIRQETEICEC